MCDGFTELRIELLRELSEMYLNSRSIRRKSTLMVGRRLGRDSLVGLKSLMKMKRRMERGGWLTVVVGSENIGDGVRTSGVQSLTSLMTNPTIGAIKNHGTDRGYQSDTEEHSLSVETVSVDIGRDRHRVLISYACELWSSPISSLC